MNPAKNKVSQEQIERYLLDELSEKEKKFVEEECEKNPQLKEEIDNLKKDNEDFLKQYPVDKMVEQISNRYQEQVELNNSTNEKNGIVRLHRFTSRKVVLTMMAAAITLTAFTVYFTWLQFLFHTEDVNTENTTRLKGLTQTETVVDFSMICKPQIFIFRRGEESHDQLTQEELVKENDILQLSYSLQKDAYGTILSLDGRDTITQHFPEQGGIAKLMDAGDQIPLKSAYQLDDAPKYEFFFMVVSKKPFQIDMVQKALAKAITTQGISESLKLDLPPQFSQTSVLLFKTQH